MDQLIIYFPDKNLFMKRKILLFLLLFSSIIIYGLNQPDFIKASEQTNTSIPNFETKKAVLVELFTSESCAACPPAEELLTKLEREQPFENAELITLEFHVDYRDGFGRKDIYASPLFTQRQRVYDRKFRTGKIYTPQMVVDGDIEFIGSKFDKAEKAVEKTIKIEKGDLNLTLKDNRLNIKISDLPEHESATVYLAIAEDGIITRNRTGADATNASIVRRLNGLGRIEPNQNMFEMNTNFQIQEGWKKENIKLVVFIQENSSRKIYGVGRISLNTTNENHKL
jgi:hypothetical protein